MDKNRTDIFLDKCLSRFKALADCKPSIRHGEFLSCIFKDIRIPGKGATGSATYKFPLIPLTSKSDVCFPKQDAELQVTEDAPYKHLWTAFNNEYESMRGKNEFNEECFWSLLKKYTWCIPSEPDKAKTTSLYDELKTESAFAVCKHDYDNADDAKKSNLPYLLLGCDVASIQKFVYSISTRKAAVSLKGRSFYVQLLVDALIMRICRNQDIQAIRSQVVYSSGGKFYMLLPNINKVKAAIERLKEEVETFLFKEHHGQLVLNISYVPFGKDESTASTKNIILEDGSHVEIGILWKEIADKLNDCKSHKFSTYLNQSLFQPQSVVASVQVCAVTGIESDLCVAIDKKAVDKTYVLPIVKAQALMGNKLKDATYLAMWTEPCEHEPDMEIFGVYFKLLLTNDINSHKDIPGLVLLSINNTEHLVPCDNNVDVGYKFYGGNEQARKGYSDNKTFEELADGQYLGILRMDVDNLGAIFINGLPDSAKNFAAYSTMSFLLDYFFCGYLNTIRNTIDIANGINFKDNVNILYSGGDDVFAIGRWDQLILFAETISKEFKRFTGRNDLSISGGISFVGSKFPLSKAAELAGDAEDAAKHDNEGQKNSFNMFGKTVAWIDEYDFVKEKKNRFVELINKYDMPKSILHKIMLLCEQKDQGDISYIWQAAYFFSRFSKGKTNQVQSFCAELQKLISDNRRFEILEVSARWAEYELRFH